MVIRTHDLIEVTDLSCLSIEDDKEWTAASLQRTPFVVVRRAEILQNGFIPVGIRGPQRNQRAAALLSPQGTGRIISPYEISRQRLWTTLSPERQNLPVLQILNTVAELMSGWLWGPTGSTGFEIITGYPAMKDTSDLDLVIDCPGPFDYNQAKNLVHELDQLGVRIDIQLETPDGAYILREITGGRTETVMLRTVKGPKLVKNPWQ